jgi:hypothetical protein
MTDDNVELIRNDYEVKWPFLDPTLKWPKPRVCHGRDERGVGRPSVGGKPENHPQRVSDALLVFCGSSFLTASNGVA